MWRVHTNQAPGDLQLEKAKQLGGVLGRRDEGSWVERHLLCYPRGGRWRGAVVSTEEVGGRK